MNDDLMRRLRQWESTWDLIKNAADRIEQLEAALRAVIVHCELPAPPNAEALKMFARKALNTSAEPVNETEKT